MNARYQTTDSSCCSDSAAAMSDAGETSETLMSETQSIVMILSKLMNSSDVLAASVESFDFDCFKMTELLGREHTFTVVSYHLIMNISSLCAEQDAATATVS